MGMLSSYVMGVEGPTHPFRVGGSALQVHQTKEHRSRRGSSLSSSVLSILKEWQPLRKQCPTCWADGNDRQTVMRRRYGHYECQSQWGGVKEQRSESLQCYRKAGLAGTYAQNKNDGQRSQSTVCYLLYREPENRSRTFCEQTVHVFIECVSHTY